MTMMKKKLKEEENMPMPKKEKNHRANVKMMKRIERNRPILFCLLSRDSIRKTLSSTRRRRRRR
jgi:hypothetical protein